MSKLETKVVTEEITQPDGSIQVIEKTTTYGGVKKAVLRRQNLAPFGSVVGEEFSRAIEKPIEIRCLPPAAAQQLAEDALLTQNEPTFVEIPSAPRCKHCGMEGHLSLKCPKRKEIEVKVKPEQNQEVTVLLSDISDLTTRAEIFAIVDDAAEQVNSELSRQPGYYPITRAMIKSTLPLTQDGVRHRGIAYVNIQWNPSAEQFAAGLVDKLDGAKVGMVLIGAKINVSSKARRAPNRYDDEEKWGALGGRR